MARTCRRKSLHAPEYPAAFFTTAHMSAKATVEESAGQKARRPRPAKGAHFQPPTLQVSIPAAGNMQAWRNVSNAQPTSRSKTREMSTTPNSAEN